MHTALKAFRSHWGISVESYNTSYQGFSIAIEGEGVIYNMFYVEKVSSGWFAGRFLYPMEHSLRNFGDKRRKGMPNHVRPRSYHVVRGTTYDTFRLKFGRYKHLGMIGGF